MKYKFIYLLLILLFNSNIYAEKSRKQVVQELFGYVEKWMGTRYIYGGSSGSGIDCSAFTGKVYNEVFNITLPRTVNSQKGLGKMVTGKLQPGDLVFFNIGGKISHVGIYVFDTKFIHAASAGPETGVIKSSLDEKYYKNRFVYAKRLVNLPASGGNTKDMPEDTSDERIIRNENKCIVDNPDLIDFKIGSTVYRGNVMDEANEFDYSRGVVFSFNNINHSKRHFVVTIENLDTEVSKKIHLFDVKKTEKIIRKVFLKKGSFVIRVKQGNEELLFEKNITVM